MNYLYKNTENNQKVSFYAHKFPESSDLALAMLFARFSHQEEYISDQQYRAIYRKAKEISKTGSSVDAKALAMEVGRKHQLQNKLKQTKRRLIKEQERRLLKTDFFIGSYAVYQRPFIP